ncbi:hypothetical protein [Aurantiacibacter gilvus]|uniref:DUF1579 domain-containing protein n=1 Tax=Aurantiacibacter gilvus TaxID=3139141 RepID=A0ABU9ICG5_9SPHN
MGILAASLLAIMQQAMLLQGSAAPPAPTPPNPCAAEEFAAFDFWVGEWEVYQTGTETQVATSRIEKVSNGCAVRETWMPLRGGGGSSLTTLDPQTGTWHQLWVGGQPGRVFFEGGPVDGAMVLTGYWGQDAEGRANLVRMIYTLGEDGSVRQHGEASVDHGQTWGPSFDLTYRPKEG